MDVEMPDFNRVRGWVCDGTRGTQADKAHDLFVELRHDAVDARAEDPIGPEYGCLFSQTRPRNRSCSRAPALSDPGDSGRALAPDPKMPRTHGEVQAIVTRGLILRGHHVPTGALVGSGAGAVLRR